MNTDGTIGGFGVRTQATIYVADPAHAWTSQVSDWLRESADVSHVTSLQALPGRCRELQRENGGLPVLALVSADTLTPGFIEACRQLTPLLNEGRLGVGLLIHGTPPDMDQVHAAHEAGCLDVVHLAQPLPPAELNGRLRLARQILHERHLRATRERSFRAQLAERRVMEARLNYIASHDELTDLANRRAFEKALDRAIVRGHDDGITHALLYLDLDRFKLHNDAAGHGSGDYLLREVGNLLRAALPAEYLLARLGSDEFAVLLQGADADEGYATAERLRNIVAAIEPDTARIIYHVEASIGMAVIAPGAVNSASQALAQAEQACYLAKTRGGNAVHRYSHNDDALQQLRDDMQWGLPIRQALAGNEFFLAYQPIQSIAAGNVSHYEALLRLSANLGGDGRSAHFMMAAERLGLARQVDLWVVDNAIDFLARHPELSLGVNLSSHAFQEAALLPQLRRRLEHTAVAPERLIFEITETAAVTNFAETRRMIGGLRDLGCRFALDDFGSGFSSYNYLKQFPVDMLKIDGSFVTGVRHDRRDQAIVQSMIDIAHRLDKEVVAEFIEDMETYRLLVDMGIDYAQGYYIGEPIEWLY